MDRRSNFQDVNAALAIARPALSRVDAREHGVALDTGMTIRATNEDPDPYALLRWEDNARYRVNFPRGIRPQALRSYGTRGVIDVEKE